jgi:uncharacterized membrane protein
MKNSFSKELTLLIIVAVPFVYLAVIWSSLPDVVPVHWDLQGNVNRTGSKFELVLIPVLLPLLMYVIMTFAPSIDPKGKIATMGSKFQALKTILTIFMSALATFIIYTATGSVAPSFNFMAIFLGLLFTVLGNYFQTIKPNYFIGIRTPWALENEEVWRKTHQFGGKLWFAGGLVIILAGLFLKEETYIVVFIGITILLVVIPFVYSYREFKKISKAV